MGNLEKFFKKQHSQHINHFFKTLDMFFPGNLKNHLKKKIFEETSVHMRFRVHIPIYVVLNTRCFSGKFFENPNFEGEIQNQTLRICVEWSGALPCIRVSSFPFLFFLSRVCMRETERRPESQMRKVPQEKEGGKEGIFE